MSFTALIDYGMGNLLSVSKALTAAGADVRIVKKPAEASQAEHIVLPGVGNFGEGMEHLRAAGFIPFIREWIRQERPFLGICLGFQMLFDSSEEAPGTPGLGILQGRVVRFPAGIEKVPHIGWNSVRPNPASPAAFFTENMPSEPWFYFVHSFYVCPENPEETGAVCRYILPFTAAVVRKNLLAVQFHPEKSQATGLQLLRNFLHYTQHKEIVS